jgi:hypothetical protein
MKKRNENDSIIREKLFDAEMQAPDFDALLDRETLDEVAFRLTCSSKLKDHSVEAPDFDDLFKNELLENTLHGSGIKKGRIRRIQPLWWTLSSVAAACIVVALLLPGAFNSAIKRQNSLAVKQSLPEKSGNPKSAKSHRPFQQVDSVEDVRKTSLYASLNQPVKPDTSIAKLALNNDTARNTPGTKDIIAINKIGSSGKLSLLTTKEQTLENRQTHIPKIKATKDNASLGLNMNGSNRLLSSLNSGNDPDFSMSAVASKSGDGYDRIDGATTLRSSTATKNQWEEVENIDGSMLSTVKTRYLLPINIGLTVSVPVSGNFNIITGLQYTYVANQNTGDDFKLKQELHYLGIPVKLSFNLLKRNLFTAYISAGGTIEKGLAGVQTSDVENEDSWVQSQSVKGFAASLMGNLGIGYSIRKDVQLCVEPGVSWYLPTDQPICYRTVEPLTFNLSVGVRYLLQ